MNFPATLEQPVSDLEATLERPWSDRGAILERPWSDLGATSRTAAAAASATNVDKIMQKSAFAMILVAFGSISVTRPIGYFWIGMVPGLPGSRWSQVAS